MSRIEIVRLCVSIKSACENHDRIAVMCSIENVLQNNFIYTRNTKASKAAQSKVALSVGRCQQAMTELMRDLDDAGIMYVMHRPQSGNWANNKAEFERVTKWKESSNADTRSAAFFGYLEASKCPNMKIDPVMMYE